MHARLMRTFLLWSFLADLFLIVRGQHDSGSTIVSVSQRTVSAHSHKVKKSTRSSADHSLSLAQLEMASVGQLIRRDTHHSQNGEHRSLLDRSDGHPTASLDGLATNLDTANKLGQSGLYTSDAAVSSRLVGTTASPVVSNELLKVIAIACALCLVALLASVMWLRRGLFAEPRAESLRAPLEGTVTSLPQIWGITSLNFAYGFVCCHIGVFLMPTEAQTMFPGHPGVALGAFEALVACSMLIGPLAGRISDSLRHPLGRRRPIVHIGTQVAAACTIAMWIASLYNLRAVFVVCVMLQQAAWNAVNASQTALLTDLVDPSRKDFASGLQVASLLAGAIASILVFQSFALESIDFRMNYLPMVIVSWLTLPLTHISAQEQPSDCLSIPPQVDWQQPRKTFSEVFYQGDGRSPDFAMITRERGVYYAGVTSKAFVFFFLKDGLGIQAGNDQAIFLGDVAMTSTCFATTAGLLVALLFRRSATRPQVVACFGGLLMAFSSQSYGAMYPSTLAARKLALLCYIAGYGAGQGCYLAGDLALAIRTMPDPNEASRYMGLWGLSAFIGGSLGSVGSATLMEVFGRIVPRHMGIHVAQGSYHMLGYISLVMATFVCDTYVALTCLRVRTRDEYNKARMQN